MADNLQRDNVRLNICAQCNHKNRPGDLICQNCGFMLVEGGGGKTKKLDERNAVRLEGNTFQQERDETTTHFPPGTLLQVRLKEVDEPMLYTLDEGSLTIGRFDRNTGQKPDIDMYQYAGYLLGVSRKHAMLHRVDDELVIEDLGSSNGTYVNGDRLGAYELRVVPDEATVRLGDLHFTVKFQ
jgi:hypothetical protein